MLVVDLSKIRVDAVLEYLEEFIFAFFDQNPISQLGVIVTRNGHAEKISELSGNASRHVESLRKLEEGSLPSLQNALQMAGASMKYKLNRFRHSVPSDTSPGYFQAMEVRKSW